MVRFLTFLLKSFWSITNSQISFFFSDFPVTQFNGKKLFILSNTSWLGGKNPFLGIAYIVTGSLCILVDGILFVIYKKFGVRERDMAIVDSNTPFIYSNLDQSK